MKKTILFVLFMLTTTGLLSACSNTLDGVGKDMEKAGRRMQQTF